MRARHTETIALVGLEIFTGVMAIVGTIGLLSGAWSEGLPVTWLQGSPFRSYAVPALALFVLVGGSSFLAAGLLVRRHPAGAAASAVAGVILVIFEVVEYLVIGLTFFLQPLMLVVGVLLIVLGAVLARKERVVRAGR